MNDLTKEELDLILFGLASIPISFTVKNQDLLNANAIKEQVIALMKKVEAMKNPPPAPPEEAK
jgi:hypothetical protein